MKPYPRYARAASPWVDTYPDGWREARFRHHAVINGGQVDPRESPWSDMVLVAPNHIESGTGKILEAESATAQGADSGKYTVDAGQVMYSKIRPALNKVATATEDCLCSADMYAMSFSDQMHIPFAVYFMLARPFHTFATVTSMRVKMPKINREDLADAPWLVPPIAEQRAIADYLDRETARIDTLIEEQQRLVEMLRRRRRAVLDSLTAAAEGPRVRLKYLYAPSSEANHPDEEVLSVYRDYGVIPKSSREDNFNRTPENVARYLLVQPGDVVINRMKAWQGSLGVSEHRGIVSGDYEVVRPTGDRLVPRFTHLFLRSPMMIAEYAVRSTGIRPSQWRLYWDQMGNIEVPVPPITWQSTVVARVDEQTAKIDTLIAETERFIEVSRERRSALITAAVTGQIDVRGEVA